MSISVSIYSKIIFNSFENVTAIYNLNMPTAHSFPPLLVPRRKRFVRETPVPFKLTDRDIELVRRVADHRFLRSTHLSELLQAPHKKICERLGYLFHASYLDRPRAQFEAYRLGGGSAAMVYALADHGARLLIDQGSDAADVDWARKNNLASRRFIEHTLAIADVRVALQRAIRLRPGYEILEPEFLLQRTPEVTQRRDRPWLLRASVSYNGARQELGVEPDYVFGIGTPERRFRGFLLECDRGTMPVDRGDLKQTSLKRKFLAYAAAKTSRLHEQQFRWSAFRVLVVTTNVQRADNTLKVIRDCVPEHDRGLFLVADRQSLSTGDIISYPWRDARGQTHGLF
jgi:hypothetical protein